MSAYFSVLIDSHDGNLTIERRYCNTNTGAPSRARLYRSIVSWLNRRTQPLENLSCCGFGNGCPVGPDKDRELEPKGVIDPALHASRICATSRHPLDHALCRRRIGPFSFSPNNRRTMKIKCLLTTDSDRVTRRLSSWFDEREALCRHVTTMVPGRYRPIKGAVFGAGVRDLPD